MTSILLQAMGGFKQPESLSLMADIFVMTGDAI